MTPQEVAQSCRERMDKSVEYLDREMRGLRTGRASTALIEYLRVNYYGNPTELRELAAISVPEPTQLVVKAFDPTSTGEIAKTIETADLGLNPMVDGTTIRINVPSPSQDRRKQLVNQVRKLAEDAKVAIRNERRDAIKTIDSLVKDKNNSISEDQGKAFKDEIDELTKTHTESIDQHCHKKVSEIEET